MARAHCKTCGEPGMYNGFTMGVRKKPPLPLPNGGAVDQKGHEQFEKPNPRAGWGHHDGMKRDHTFHPHDNRSPEADMDRQRESHLLARLSVEHTVQKQFDHQNAENRVNDLFNDRR